MGRKKPPSPFSAPPQPALTQTTVCEVGRRCHVAGQKLKTFGTAFPQATISAIASSSVLLVENASGQPQRPIASGTLISDTVVLCASHSLQGVNPLNIRVLLFHEASAATAPPGNRDQYPRNDPTAWRAGTSLRTNPQAKVVKLLEEGDPLGFDYGLLAIHWTELTADPGGNFVAVPRASVLSRSPSRTYSKEVVVVGHPVEVFGHSPPQTMSDVETAQATVGILTKQFGPNFETNKGLSYSYATYSGEFGMSGGGVFNTSGNIIGVLKGWRAGLGGCFLNLGEAATGLPTSRLSNWFNGGSALRPGDPSQTIVFVKASS